MMNVVMVVAAALRIIITIMITMMRMKTAADVAEEDADATTDLHSYWP